MNVTISTASDRLTKVDEKIEQALTALQGEANASPALKAVVEEFRDKSRKALDDLEAAEDESIRDHIIELEQAGDSAKCAAQAEQGLSDKARKAILGAHEVICALKSEILEE
jgi:hypothetical protein